MTDTIYAVRIPAPTAIPGLHMTTPPQLVTFTEDGESTLDATRRHIDTRLVGVAPVRDGVCEAPADIWYDDDFGNEVPPHNPLADALTPVGVSLRGTVVITGHNPATGDTRGLTLEQAAEVLDHIGYGHLAPAAAG